SVFHGQSTQVLISESYSNHKIHLRKRKGLQATHNIIHTQRYSVSHLKYLPFLIFVFDRIYWMFVA
ncbi:MAG: hypothetical protein KAV45_08200, partial [Calditrichia bacterium]|nr:hypothetical protein [Calditrichia bacterium]